ncbi:jg10196 [Pararge aegeria aegeria]|uniref:Jg10196 protein n=1 Tax=Pararge aegeria aegeria TaxID=348720 RepID=A0A8S4QJZ5_9NEOP|nr:jg10196 [Pararge aegeria aegeria]
MCIQCSQRDGSIAGRSATEHCEYARTLADTTEHLGTRVYAGGSRPGLLPRPGDRYPPPFPSSTQQVKMRAPPVNISLAAALSNAPQVLQRTLLLF